MKDGRYRQLQPVEKDDKSCTNIKNPDLRDGVAKVTLLSLSLPHQVDIRNVQPTPLNPEHREALRTEP